MRNEFKMKEATTKQEAIISICDVMQKSPLFLNKCTSDLFIITKTLQTTKEDLSTYTIRKNFLNSLNFHQVKDLFIEIKTEYYNFKDITQWNY
jgi:hypothetical protein